MYVHLYNNTQGLTYRGDAGGVTKTPVGPRCMWVTDVGKPRCPVVTKVKLGHGLIRVTTRVCGCGRERRVEGHGKWVYDGFTHPESTTGLMRSRKVVDDTNRS